MNHFTRKRGELFCEGVALARIAEEVGTPSYVYSSATLRRHARVFLQALEGLDALVCFAMKACPNLGVLKLLAGEGYGFDIVSRGELHRALLAGGKPSRIVFSGVGKRRDELEAALRADILEFNCESEEELRQLDEVARRLRTRARIAIRVNPEVDARTHPYIATALATSKFGIPWRRARAAYRLAASLPGLEVVGVACHIGSQIGELAPFIEAAKRLRELVKQLRDDGHRIRHVDIGGGLGVPYGDGPAPPAPDRYGRALAKVFKGLDARVLFEPGRLLVANAGVLLTRVLLTKQGARGRNFAVVDAAMNDLIRPSLYDAHHEVEPVGRPQKTSAVYDVVGPICESGDVLAQRRRLPRLGEGDLVVLRSAGAYGMAMSSQYNARPRAAEVLVDGRTFRVVRARESLDDLVRGERA